MKCSSILVFFVSLVFASCTGRADDYGVLLAPASTIGLDAGSVVVASEVSPVTDLVTVSTLEDEPRSEEIRPGFVKRFDELNDAVAFSKRYTPFRDARAYATVQALRIREEPSLDSADVYRLRRGEAVKLIQRVDGQDTINGRTGHWYEVLTLTGVRGYTFGPLLRQGAEQSAAAAGLTQDESLRKFLSNSWRPAYMADMLASGRIDLRRFDPQIGIFPDTDAGTVVLYTGMSKIEAPIDEVSKRGPSVFVFGDDALQVEVRPDDEVIALYQLNNTRVRERYVLLDVDIEEIIAEEQERRDAIYARITSVSRRFRSNNYGTFTLAEDRTITWNGFGDLVPQLIPRDATGTGEIYLDLFLSAELQEEYDGAMTIALDTGGGAVRIAVVYDLTASGIRMTLIDRELGRDDLIESVELGPLILYFSAAPDPTSSD